MKTINILLIWLASFNLFMFVCEGLAAIVSDNFDHLIVSSGHLMVAIILIRAYVTEFKPENWCWMTLKLYSVIALIIQVSLILIDMTTSRAFGVGLLLAGMTAGTLCLLIHTHHEKPGSIHA